jgi:hypothetical protein
MNPAASHSKTSPSASEVLLVTSALRPAKAMPFLELRDPTDRLHQTLCGLISWIEATPLRRLVLCDNSGISSELDGFREYAESRGAEFECLTFQGATDQIAKFGKGYGEGEILEHAFAHSRLLAECDTFYKITGRLFIKNFGALHTLHAADPVVFALSGTPWKNRFKRYLLRLGYFQKLWHAQTTHTVFYKCTPAFFRQHLLARYREVDEQKGRWLEHAYYLPTMTQGAVGFREYPTIVGMRGTLAQSYHGQVYPEAVQARARSLI